MVKQTETSGGNGTEGGMPKAAVARLSLYLRELETLHRDGHETISSTQLGQALEITDAQVRKDLAYYGPFGLPGVGYRVTELRDGLKGVLGTNRTWRMALVGVGNLGRALMGYRGFRERGFEISALFDTAPHLVGQMLDGMVIQELSELPTAVKELNLQMAILAVPAVAAEQVARVVSGSGVTGILNFAPVQLKVSEDVSVVSVDLGLQFEQLAFAITKRKYPVV